MSDNLDAIKAHIAALASKTVEAGCTEEEALAAMEMVGRLLQKYNLSMSELDVRQSQMIEDFVRINGKNINNNIGMLLSAIGIFTDCKVWIDNSSVNTAAEPKISYKFFGQSQDVKLASYLLFVCTTAMLNESKIYVKSLNLVGQGHARKPSNSFQHGFAIRIYHRLKEIKAANKAEQVATQGTALMVLKDQLVTEEWVKRTEELKLRSRVAPHRSTDGQAYSAGQNAANNLNLNNPIEHGGKGQQLGRNKLLA